MSRKLSPASIPQLAEVKFSFKVECGPDFDCAPQLPTARRICPLPPPINYLAKDYGSLPHDHARPPEPTAAQLGRDQRSRLGVVLAELIAYVGDHLSYQQDAVATEAYIETARSRISLRRHALLVDYHVHDGCNARAWIQLKVNAQVVPGPHAHPLLHLRPGHALHPRRRRRQ